MVHTYAKYMHTTSASLVLDCAGYDHFGASYPPAFVEIVSPGGRQQHFFIEPFEHYKQRNPQAVRAQSKGVSAAAEESIFRSFLAQVDSGYDSEAEDEKEPVYQAPEVPVLPVPLIGAASPKGPYTIKKIDASRGCDWEINIPKGELSAALEECLRLRDVERELHLSGKVTHSSFSREFHTHLEKCEEMFVRMMGEEVEDRQFVYAFIQDKFHKIGIFMRNVFSHNKDDGFGRSLPITEEDKNRGVEAIFQIETDASYRLRKGKVEENAPSNSVRDFVQEIMGVSKKEDKKEVVLKGTQRFIQAINEGEIQIFDSPLRADGTSALHIKRFRYTWSLREQAAIDLAEIRAYFKIPAESTFPRMTEQQGLGYVDFGLHWEKEYLVLRGAPPEEQVLIERIRVMCDAIHAQLPGAPVPVPQKQIEQIVYVLTPAVGKSIFSAFKNTLFSKEITPTDRVIAHLRVNARDARSVIAVVQLAMQDGLGDQKALQKLLKPLEKLARAQSKQSALAEPQGPRR